MDAARGDKGHALAGLWKAISHLRNTLERKPHAGHPGDISQMLLSAVLDASSRKKAERARLLWASQAGLPGRAGPPGGSEEHPV